MGRVKNSFPKSVEIIPFFIQVIYIDVSFIQMHPLICSYRYVEVAYNTS